MAAGRQQRTPLQLGRTLSEHAEQAATQGFFFIMNRIRFVMVGFDGLRPADIRDDNMPNLARFMRENHVWDHYVAGFPTETYVNHPSIFTGFRPTAHGIIQNWYYRRGRQGAESIFRGSSEASVMAHEHGDGGIIRVPSIGDRLARDGMKMRVYCANSPGSTRLQHVHANSYAGHLCASVHDMASTIPASEIESLARDGVTGLPLRFPDFDGNRLVVDGFIKHELPRGVAEMTVLWIGEPDHSSHEFGLDDPRTEAARKDADEQFGRVLEWWEREGRAQGVQLIAISDHGHGTVRRHVDIKAIFAKAGLKVINALDVLNGAKPEEADAVLVGNYAAGLWLTQPTPENLLRFRDALMASPDVGLVFSRADERTPHAIVGRVPGTFSERVVYSDHERSPDLRFVMRGDPVRGELVMDEELVLGAGNHGGLLPQELSSLLAVGGSHFPGSARHEEPASHDDLAVTMMTMLGLLDDEALLPLPTGRCLVEALAGGNAKPDAPVRERLTLSCGSFEQTIERANYASRSYILCGSRSMNDGWRADRKA